MTTREIASSERTEAIQAFVKQLLEMEDNHNEQRAVRRHGAMMEALAVPLDEGLQPSGPAFRVVTRDISTRGLGLIHCTPIIDQYLRITIAMPNGYYTKIVAEVRRCQPLGDFFEIGCKFIERL